MFFNLSVKCRFMLLKNNVMFTELNFMFILALLLHPSLLLTLGLLHYFGLCGTIFKGVHKNGTARGATILRFVPVYHPNLRLPYSAISRFRWYMDIKYPVSKIVKLLHFYYITFTILWYNKSIKREPLGNSLMGCFVS